MIAKHIAGATHNPGAPAGWDPKRDGTCGRLPIRVRTNGEQIAHCESAWEPTPKELEMLNAGGQVILRVIGWQVPVALYVEALPKEETAEPQPDQGIEK